MAKYGTGYSKLWTGMARGTAGQYLRPYWIGEQLRSELVSLGFELVSNRDANGWLLQYLISWDPAPRARYVNKIGRPSPSIGRVDLSLHTDPSSAYPHDRAGRWIEARLQPNRLQRFLKLIDQCVGESQPVLIPFEERTVDLCHSLRTGARKQTSMQMLILVSVMPSSREGVHVPRTKSTASSER